MLQGFQALLFDGDLVLTKIQLQHRELTVLVGRNYLCDAGGSVPDFYLGARDHCACGIYDRALQVAGEGGKSRNG